MDGSHLRVLYVLMQGTCAYEFNLRAVLKLIQSPGRSWTCPAPTISLLALTTPPRLNNVAGPLIRDSYTSHTDMFSRPNRFLAPPTTTDAPDAGQAVPTAEPR